MFAKLALQEGSFCLGVDVWGMKFRPKNEIGRHRNQRTESRPMTGSSFPSFALDVKSRPYCSKDDFFVPLSLLRSIRCVPPGG